MYGASASYAPSSQNGFLPLQNSHFGNVQPHPQPTGFSTFSQQAGPYGGAGGGGAAGGAQGQGVGAVNGTPQRPGMWGSSSTNNVFGSGGGGQQQPMMAGQPQFGAGGMGMQQYSAGYGMTPQQPGVVPGAGPGAAGVLDGPRRYIPGYLSTSGVTGAPMMGGPAAGAERNDEWISTSPSGVGHRSTSPKAGFRSLAGRDSPTRSPRGGVFGKSLAASLKPRKSGDPMEEDAPPTMSMFDDESFANPAGPLAVARKESPSHQDQDEMPAPTGHKVLIFGFPSSHQHQIVAHFSHIGDFLSHPEPSPEGGNWVTLTYSHEWAAQRAVRKNGDVVESNVMVGVRWADEARDRTTRDNIALGAGVGGGAINSLDPTPSTPATVNGTSTGNQLARVQTLRGVPPAGRPLKTFASTEAFAKPSTPLHHTPGAGTPVGKFLREAGRGPNAATFEGAMEEERSREERAAKGGGGGILTRAADFVFGF